jgi:cysteine synthase
MLVFGVQANRRSHSMTISATMLEAIGRTPIVALRALTGLDHARVLVKLEGLNPTGSYKDRMALAMIEGAERRGDLRPGMTVVEYTGGSTGSSLAFVCAVKGYPFKVVSSDAFASEKLETMTAFGADLTIVPSHGKGITRELLQEMIATARELATKDSVYWTNQFENIDSLDGYQKIGEELISQVGGPIDVFCGGVGTGGMIMGVARAFRRAGMSTEIVVVEPSESPVLSSGVSGSHHIEGVGVGFRPPLLDDELFQDVVTVDEAVARETARWLAREEGILAGTSTGMNVAAALELARRLGPGKTVATVASDTGLKYLSGGLYRAP